jgi:hypothetical protein
VCGSGKVFGHRRYLIAKWELREEATIAVKNHVEAEIADLLSVRQELIA